MQNNSNMMIRIALLYKGWSQVELAEAIGKSTAHVSQMLSEELPEEEQLKIKKIIEEAD